MPKQALLVEVPEGYELTGEFRIPKSGELILMDGAAVGFSTFTATLVSKWFPILRRTERWRPATVADVQYPRKKARFRDFERDEWTYGELIGVQSRPTKLVWQNSLKTDFVYWHCEVLCD